jgi:Trk K+ transport system NAD-binding subunit
VRDGRLVSLKPDTVLRAGDDVLVLAEEDLAENLTRTFEGSAETSEPKKPNQPPGQPSSP